MVRKPLFAVAVVSCILVIYCILISLNISLPFVYFIFSISPFLLVWLAYTVIRFGDFRGKEFTENEEWGYEDKNRNETDVFG